MYVVYYDYSVFRIRRPPRSTRTNPLFPYPTHDRSDGTAATPRRRVVGARASPAGRQPRQPAAATWRIGLAAATDHQPVNAGLQLSRPAEADRSLFGVRCAHQGIAEADRKSVV